MPILVSRRKRSFVGSPTPYSTMMSLEDISRAVSVHQGRLVGAEGCGAKKGDSKEETVSSTAAVSSFFDRLIDLYFAPNNVALWKINRTSS